MSNQLKFFSLVDIAKGTRMTPIMATCSWLLWKLNGRTDVCEHVCTI